MKIQREKIGPIELVSIKTKRNIKIFGAYFSDFEPELQSALGATLSRDPSSIKERLEKIIKNEKIKDRIMDVYFKKYGHNSIGDMGFYIFSVEGLSMKGAFHLLENQLFNGQEASTRYLDFSKMGYLPVNSEIDKYSEKMFKIYTKLEKDLQKYFVQSENLDPKEAEPKAFDIAGAFLPISARTNVFWVGSIRTYIGQIRKLNSLGEEEKEIGEAMEKIAEIITPHSIRKVGFDYLKEEIEFQQKLIKKEYRKNKKEIISFSAFDLKNFKSEIKGKIKNVNALSYFGNINYFDELDFRSARDIHRHRSFRLNTVVDFKAGKIEEFYLNQIPKEFRKEFEKELKEMIKKLKKIEFGYYALPMAIKFPYTISGDLLAWLYFLNLRSGNKVHPTVISMVKKVGEKIEKKLGLKNIYQRNETDYSLRKNDKNKV